MKIIIQVGEFEEVLEFDRTVDVDEMKAYLLNTWQESLFEYFVNNEYDEEEHGAIPYESDTDFQDWSAHEWRLERIAEEMADQFDGGLVDVGDVVESKFMTATVIAVRDESDTWQTVPGRREWGAD